MEFKTIPFNEQELTHKYELLKFNERGYPMALLSIIDDYFFLNSKTNYKFGLISINSKEYSWFFYGKIVAKNRVDALQTYNALLSYCTKNNLGQPFAFKDI